MGKKEIGNIFNGYFVNIASGLSRNNNKELEWLPHISTHRNSYQQK